MKKLLAVGIILLLVGVSIPSIPSKPQSLDNIITVDNEGDGDYTSIKEALSNTNSGDLIEVYSGTYYEHDILIETDDITLQGIPYELENGSDTGKPFIDGQGIDETIVIKSRNIEINGFRMENKGPSSNGIIALYKESDGCIISNNDLSNSTAALIWCDGSNTTIINNNIRYNVIRQGIVLGEPGHNNTIWGNFIYDCDTGICVWDSNFNTIAKNRIMRCSDFGLDIAGSFNKVIGNHIEDNDIGVQIWNFFNQVKHNNFINNNVHAQFIYGVPILQRLTNIWFGNYWGRTRLIPYPIPGLLILMPIVQFDWHPAKEPYDIEV